MNQRAWSRGAAALAILMLAFGCGRKGPPLPPLRPLPGPIPDLAATRTDDRVTLTFTVPKANRDGSTPSVVAQVEIYVMETAPGAPAPTVAQVVTPDHLLTSLDVRPADSVRAPGDSPDRRSGPGEPAQFVDVVTGRVLGAPDAPTRHYVAIGVTGRRRGDPSPVVSVSLVKPPDVLRVANAGERLLAPKGASQAEAPYVHHAASVPPPS